MTSVGAEAGIVGSVLESSGHCLQLCRWTDALNVESGFKERHETQRDSSQGAAPFTHTCPTQEKGRQRMRWVDGITDSTDMGLSQPREMVKDGEAWRAAVHGAAESDIAW